jgi:uncharacterized FlgJ-related protein
MPGEKKKEAQLGEEMAGGASSSTLRGAILQSSTGDSKLARNRNQLHEKKEKCLP